MVTYCCSSRRWPDTTVGTSSCRMTTSRWLRRWPLRRRRLQRNTCVLLLELRAGRAKRRVGNETKMVRNDVTTMRRYNIITTIIIIIINKITLPRRPTAVSVGFGVGRSSFAATVNVRTTTGVRTGVKRKAWRHTGGQNSTGPRAYARPPATVTNTPPPYRQRIDVRIAPSHTRAPRRPPEPRRPTPTIVYSLQRRIHSRRFHGAAASRSSPSTPPPTHHSLLLHHRL